MRRFTWFKPYRRHFLSSVSSDLLVDKGDSFGKFLSSRQSLLLARTLFGCSFVTKKEETLIPRIPLRCRYFQATAYSSSAERDYYRILGVSEIASQDEIKKPFHLMAPPRFDENDHAFRSFRAQFWPKMEHVEIHDMFYTYWADRLSTAGAFAKAPSHRFCFPNIRDAFAFHKPPNTILGVTSWGNKLLSIDLY